MTNERKHKIYGYGISDCIKMFPGELDRDAVGLWQIVPAGRDGFGLDGAELADFVRRSIAELLDQGALPVRHVPGSKYEWDRQNQYGEEPHGVIEAIVMEWLAMSTDPLILCGEGVWFARPQSGKLYVKVH